VVLARRLSDLKAATPMAPAGEGLCSCSSAYPPTMPPRCATSSPVFGTAARVRDSYVRHAHRNQK